jgi:hypothetical protein
LNILRRRYERDTEVEGKRDALEPLGVDYLRQALEERLALQFDLLAETIVRDQVDVLEPVLFGHRDVAAVGHEVHRLGDAEV